MKIGGKKPEVGSSHAVKGEAGKDQVKKQDTGAGRLSTGDNVDISPRARELGRAKQMLDSVPEVRGEMVVKFKTDIDSGGYNVDAGKVAEKMIERAIRNSLYTKK